MKKVLSIAAVALMVIGLAGCCSKAKCCGSCGAEKAETTEAAAAE